MFNCIAQEEKEEGDGDGGGVGGGGSAFPLTGGSHTRFKREQNSNWLLCWPASLGLVSTKEEGLENICPFISRHDISIRICHVRVWQTDILTSAFQVKFSPELRLGRRTEM